MAPEKKKAKSATPEPKEAMAERTAKAARRAANKAAHEAGLAAERAAKAQQRFGPGAVVRLKCGGPAMVISRGKAGEEWLCHWMGDALTTQASALPEQVLMASEPDVWPRDWHPTENL